MNKKILPILLIVIFLLLNGCSNDISKKISVTSTAALESVLEINELHSIEYVYNSYAIQTDFAIDTQCIKDSIATIKDLYISEEKFLKIKKELQNLDYKSISAMQNFSKNNFNISFYENNSLIGFILTFSSFINDCSLYTDYLLKNNSDYLYSIEFSKIIDRTIFEYKKANMNYAISYRGFVIAGIDEPIDFSVDNENKIITVKIPKAKIISSTVSSEQSTMKFLYKDSKYKKIGDIKNVLELCKEDLALKVKDNKAFLDLAQQNVIATIQALCKPFEKNLSYKFQYETIGDSNEIR